MNTEQYIQLIAWAYFWVGNLTLGCYLLFTLSAMVRKDKMTYPFNWRAFLFLMLWLISIKLK